MDAVVHDHRNPKSMATVLGGRGGSSIRNDSHYRHWSGSSDRPENQIAPKKKSQKSPNHALVPPLFLTE